MNQDRPEVVRRFLRELEWSPTKKYVELLRERDALLTIDGVDIDVPQIVRRHFVCDARRCIEWAEGNRPLVDRSCCCRYDVPVTARDRAAVRGHLKEVRRHLPEGHRLRDRQADPFQTDGDFGYQMVHDNPLGGCQFNLYLDGRCRCALHATALARGHNPLDLKPLACSLWPLALTSYTDDGPELLLLTIYCDATTELFDETDDEPFACIVDEDPSYPRTYQSERAVLEYLFGAAWWQKLDQAARPILAQKPARRRPRP